MRWGLFMATQTGPSNCVIGFLVRRVCFIWLNVFSDSGEFDGIAAADMIVLSSVFTRREPTWLEIVRTSQQNLI